MNLLTVRVAGKYIFLSVFIFFSYMVQAQDPLTVYNNVGRAVSGMPGFQIQSNVGLCLTGTGCNPGTIFPCSPGGTYTYWQYGFSGDLGGDWPDGAFNPIFTTFVNAGGRSSISLSPSSPNNTVGSKNVSYLRRVVSISCPHTNSGGTIEVFYNITVNVIQENIITGFPSIACTSDATFDIVAMSNYPDITVTVDNVPTGTIFNPAAYTPGIHVVRIFRAGFYQGTQVTQKAIEIVAAPSNASSPLATPNVICEGGSTTLTASGASTDEVYRWFTASTGGTALPSNTPTINTTGNYTYWVEKFNTVTGCKSASRVSTSVQVNKLAVISAQPSPVALCPGATLNLSVTSTGVPTPTYQWLLNGAPISGATASTYNKTSVNAFDDGNYVVQITNSCGTVVSNLTAVTVRVPASINTQPLSASGCAGNLASLSVAAVGTGLTYQWQKFNGSVFANVSNGSGISGATSSTLTFNPATIPNTGDYRVNVIGSCNTVISSSATLNIITTGIATQPVNTGVCPNGSAILSVVASGTGPFSYQWAKKSGMTYNNISGQVGSSLTIVGATAPDAGTYRVTVTGACGSINSSDAVLSINAIPSAPTAPNVARCGTGPLSATANSPASSPTYKWYANIGDALPTSTGATYTITNLTASVDFYVSVTSSGCESPRTTVSFSRFDAVPVDLGGDISLCIAQGLYDMEADIGQAVAVGNDFTWTVGATNFIGKIFNPSVGAGSYTISYTPPAVAQNTPHCMMPSTRVITVITGAGTGGITFDPLVVSTGNTINSCVGDDPIILTDLPSAAGGAWSTISGQGLTFNGATAIFTPNASSFTSVNPNVFRYTVDVGGCTASLDLNIFVKDNQNIPIVSGVPSIICPGANLTLAASVADPGTFTYEWLSPSNPTPLSINNPYSFIVNQSETIQARSINTFGCRSVAKIIEIVTPFSGGEIEVNKSVINTTDNVRFKYTVTSPGNTYKWNFGDGFTSVEQNPVHYYYQPGTFLVGLTVTSSLGCSQPLTFNSIQVDGVPFEVITGDIDRSNSALSTYPNPVTTLFTIDSEEPILSFVITDLNGQQIIKGNSQDLNSLDIDTSALASGVYIISLEFQKYVHRMKFMKK